MLLGMSLLTACGSPESIALSYEAKTLSNDDCRCTVEVPNNWDETLDFHPQGSIEAGNFDTEELFMVLHLEKQPGQETISVRDYGNYVLEGVESSADTFTVNSAQEITINGLPGYQVEVSAVIDQQESINIFTFLGDEENFYQIVAWSSNVGFPIVEGRLYEATSTFRVLPQ